MESFAVLKESKSKAKKSLAIGMSKCESIECMNVRIMYVDNNALYRTKITKTEVLLHLSTIKYSGLTYINIQNHSKT